MKFANKVNSARALALLVHDTQQYGEGLPYSYHLDRVYQALVRFGVTDRDVLAAAYLHDAMEDTECTQAVIFDLFGGVVTSLVAAVTDEKGANRKERKAKTYPKIRAAGGDAVLIKLADRIANLEHAHAACNLRMWKMYHKEQGEFEAQLAGHVDAPQPDVTLLTMWAHLGSLLKDEPKLPPVPAVKMEI